MRLEFMVSSSATADTKKSEAEFNTAFQIGATASGLGIIKRTCTLGTYCKIAEMIYMRKDPSVSFAPYSCMFTSWEEGSDNVHGTDFELYASTIDALNDNNKFTACNFGSSRRAFGDCAPTALVTNNQIGDT